MVYKPLAAPNSTEKLADFSEDCLRIENPNFAAAQLFEAAQEISGSGVAFSLPYFFWLRKRNRVVSRARDGFGSVQINRFAYPTTA